MQLPAHRSATMVFQFSDLPHDLMEAVFEALPSVYQIYKCSLVCRAWRGPALRVLERRRAAIIADDIIACCESSGRSGCSSDGMSVGSCTNEADADMVTSGTPHPRV